MDPHASANRLSHAESDPTEFCQHGGSFWRLLGDEFESLTAAHDVISADVLDAWFDPAPAVIETLRENLPLLVRTSPPTHAEGMIRVIARVRGLNPESILTAAGSSALIFLAFQRWFTSRSRVLLLDPMYAEYRHILTKIVGCQVDSLIATAETNFAFDLAAVAEQLATTPYDAVILVNPNSPTGRLIPAQELAALVRRFANVRFWIDETYMEYAGPEQSLEKLACELRNVFVSKSMSKVYALSGLRAAYLVGSPAAIAALGTHLPPWAVSLPAQLAAVTALQCDAYYRARYRETAQLREALVSELTTGCGLQVFPSITNFFLGALPNEVSADSVVQRCEAQKLFLRTGASIHSSLGPRTLRIAVKDAATNARLAEILRGAVLAEDR